MSVIYIILVTANLFGKSGNIIIGNGIRGYGDTKWMFFTQALGTVGVVGLSCLCVFVFKLGMLGVFIAVLCDEAIRAVINFIRFLKNKVLANNVEPCCRDLVIFRDFESFNIHAVPVEFLSGTQEAAEPEDI